MNTIPIDSSFGLHPYLNWRKTLAPLDDGTIIRWISDTPSRGSTSLDDIKKGQCFKILENRKPLMQRDPIVAGDMVYKMVRCSKTGKEYTRQHYYSVEGIARMIVLGTMEVVDAR